MPAIPGSWTAEREQAFEAMLDPLMYGNSFTFNGTTYDCIAPDQEVILRMMENSYEHHQTGTFSMLGTDFAASKIKNRDTIQYQGYNFQVLSFSVDPVDSSIDLTVFYKQ